MPQVTVLPSFLTVKALTHGFYHHHHHHYLYRPQSQSRQSSVAVVVGPRAGVKETSTGFSIYHQGDEYGLWEKGEKGGGRREEGMEVRHNKTAILDKKPSPFLQFTDQKTLGPRPRLCPALVPGVESCLGTPFCCSLSSFSIVCLIPSPYVWKIAADLPFSFLPLLPG